MAQQYYNIHTHSFTMKNAPTKFLELYLPAPIAKLIDSITEVQAGSFIIQQLLSRFGGNGGKRYASFLKIGKSKNQPAVFNELLKNYKDDPQIKLIGLTMNMEHCGAGDSVSGYEGQLQEVLEIKKNYPDQLLLFLGVDPNWKSTGKLIKDEVMKKFETKLDVGAGRKVYPYVGLKIYPSMGFYPFDERLMETFIWAAENDVPVLSHCSYLGGIYNNTETHIDNSLLSKDPYNGFSNYPSNGISYQYQRRIGRWLTGRQKSTNNLNKCSYYMEPAAFESILRYFSQQPKPLKLCLAHFGGHNQLKDAITSPGISGSVPYGASGKNWYQQILDLMKEYKSIYTDISYTLFDHNHHDDLLKEINHPVYGNQILFGTDFFMSEREKSEEEIYITFKKNAVKTLSGNAQTAWDKVAGTNIENFLRSKFY